MNARHLVPTAVAASLAIAPVGLRAQAAPNWGAPGAQPASSSPVQPGRPWTAPATATPSNAFGVASPAPSRSSAVAPAKGSLFDLPDATPITTGGRPSTAGALKHAIQATIAAKAGPRRTVVGPQRVLDAAHVAGATPLPVRGDTIGKSIDRATLTAKATTANPLAVGGGRSTLTQPAGDSPVRKLLCTDDGPPAISEVDGVLTPGGQATVYGTCFGRTAGHVQVIGQFGTIDAAFTEWGMTGIALQIPAGMRGTADGTVAVTVVAADGRKSPAAQAMFRAARERVEVPSRLWQPGAGFDVTATTDVGGSLFGPPPTNVAQAGSLARNLRINPACALDAMSVDVISGDVTAIRGFDQGPPNEANTTIDWTGTCVDTKTTTTTDYVLGTSTSVSITKACRVALEPRAWAWCPVGLAP